ncbi:MAG: ankyrin repeat domain-containing protein [Magnetococcales bacterium]|nr:ankyrin repeat domain-containing protein [Magnetococcales bacterium]
MKIPGLALLVPGLMLSSFIDLPLQDELSQPSETVPLNKAEPIIRNPDAIITLLDQGKRLDGMDLQGQTALMWAVINGEELIATRLIEAGADVNATDWWGRSALSYALTYNHRRLIGLLIEHGANLSV